MFIFEWTSYNWKIKSCLCSACKQNGLFQPPPLWHKDHATALWHCSQIIWIQCNLNDSSSSCLHCSPGRLLISKVSIPPCFLSSLTQNAALQHLFIRKSFRPFKCSQCGKAFRDKDKLDQHMRYHGRDGCRHMCHQCGKGFLTNAALEDHLQLHSDQRTYSCLFCAESYDRLDLLKVHVGVHLVNGCFSCPSCKKTFTDFIQVWCANKQMYTITKLFLNSSLKNENMLKIDFV